MFFSKLTSGFYSRDIHGDAIPADAVEITDEYHSELLAGQSAGKRIVAVALDSMPGQQIALLEGAPVAGGYPVLADPEPTPLPIVIEQAKARVRAARVTVFGTLAGIQSKAQTDGDTATAKAISAIQDQLADLPGIDLSTCETAQDVEEAFALAWAAIAACAPEKVSKAFNQVLA